MQKQYRLRLVLETREPDTDLKWSEEQTGRAFELEATNARRIFAAIDPKITQTIELIYLLEQSAREAELGRNG